MSSSFAPSPLRRAARFGAGLVIAAALALSACTSADPVQDAAADEADAPTNCEIARARVQTDNYPIANFVPQAEGNVLERRDALMDYQRACAVLVSDKDEKLRDLVRAYLDLYQGRFGGSMVRTLEFEDGLAILAEQEAQVFERRLAKDQSYRFIGACDNECHDIDLFLVDSAGAIVAADRELDHYPVVSFTPEEDGDYRLVLQMYNCTIQPCYAGLRVLELRASWALTPSYGSHELVSGFTPDPWSIGVQSGGAVDMQQRQSSCLGYIAENPDVRVNFTAGESGLPLIFSVNAGTDTTLVINGADGLWYCDDDSGILGSNPMVIFPEPPSGQYDIWVGAYGVASTYNPATLSVSEQSSH